MVSINTQKSTKSKHLYLLSCMRFIQRRKTLTSHNHKQTCGGTKILKHEKYVDALCSQLKPDYDEILRNVPIYSKRKRLVAEIDVLAMKEGKYDVYEVKCSHRIYKAKKQLTKIRKLLRKESKEVSGVYFYCGESSTLHNVDDFFGYRGGLGTSRKINSSALAWMQKA